MPDLAPLVSHDAIASLTAAKKKSLLAAVAKELGKDWKAEPVDEALGLPPVHVPTKLRFSRTSSRRSVALLGRSPSRRPWRKPVSRTGGSCSSDHR